MKVLAADRVDAVLAKGGNARREVSHAPGFAAGDIVRTINLNPPTHTRLPRYARGRVGTIDRVHGAFVFPDTNALDKGECPEYLYSVRFTARELWGPDAPASQTIYLDLWEPYLERT